MSHSHLLIAIPSLSSHSHFYQEKKENETNLLSSIADSEDLKQSTVMEIDGDGPKEDDRTAAATEYDDVSDVEEMVTD
jgi:hypothetical protein